MSDATTEPHPGGAPDKQVAYDTDNVTRLADQTRSVDLNWWEVRLADVRMMVCREIARLKFPITDQEVITAPMKS